MKDDCIKAMNTALTAIISDDAIADGAVTEHFHTIPKEPGGTVPPRGPVEDCLRWLTGLIVFTGIFMLDSHTSGRNDSIKIVTLVVGMIV